MLHPNEVKANSNTKVSRVVHRINITFERWLLVQGRCEWKVVHKVVVIQIFPRAATRCFKQSTQHFLSSFVALTLIILLSSAKHWVTLCL